MTHAPGTFIGVGFVVFLIVLRRPSPKKPLGFCLSVCPLPKFWYPYTKAPLRSPGEALYARLYLCEAGLVPRESDGAIGDPWERA